MSFLPVSKKDLEKRNWDSLDFIIISGDAYVDHPSFGTAIISRILESKGYKVGILAQPDWKSPESFTALGEPNLAFLVTSGNIDSMVNHYTANKKKRCKDLYSPGGEAGNRPDRALLVYTSIIKRFYKNTPVILGGMEASLRRLAHYDYWSNKVRRSVLLDSKADLLVYGMAENTICLIAEKLKRGKLISAISNIPGTVVKSKTLPSSALELPAFEKITESKEKFAESFKVQFNNTDPFSGKKLSEKTGDFYIIQNPPAKPLTTAEMDYTYSLPYTKQWHPMYEKAGGIPALEEVKFSITHNRGCFGGCNFCALTFHQGRIIRTRSEQSIIKEAKELTAMPDFKGYIHDVGGPTANFRHTACKKQESKGACQDKQCLYPKACSALNSDHNDYMHLLRELRNLPNVKKVFVRSGIRFDYFLEAKNDKLLTEFIKHHVSGQLKLAPEHASAKVLAYMGKPKIDKYIEFHQKFTAINKKLGKKQYIIPYLISSHPGSKIEDAIETALFLKKNHFVPDQIQDFYPTPGTISTCMYYTGIDPLSTKKIHVTFSERERKIQRALMQFNKEENRKLVIEGLKKAGRSDLINVLLSGSHYRNKTQQGKRHPGKTRSR